MSIAFPSADIAPTLGGYTGQGPFRFWCQKVLPLVYDDSLSYYELLAKVVVYINNLIKDVGMCEENIDLLKDFMENFALVVNPETVEEILSKHPEWTTTVMDGAITRQKLDENLNNLIDRYVESKYQFKFIGHRGYPGANNIYAVDNSQVSFACAGVAGFGGIECDPTKDRDGNIVMLHGHRTQAVCWESGQISESSFEDLHYRTKAGTRTNINLCTLDNTIQIAKYYGMMIFFDMGNNTCTPKELAEACESAGFYEYGFFGVPDQREDLLLEVPEYCIKVLGGYGEGSIDGSNGFNPAEYRVQEWVEKFGTKNVCVRTQGSTTTLEETVMYKHYGVMQFLTANDMNVALPEVLENADYVFGDYPFQRYGGDSVLTGSFARSNGAVNLFKLPISNVTLWGLNIECKSDGSVSVSGTYNQSVAQVRGIGTVTLDPGTYVFSGVYFNENNPNASSGNPCVTVQLIEGVAGSFGSELYPDVGYSARFTVTQRKTYTVRLHFNAELNGVTISDLTLYPMVRFSSIVSDGFTSYAMTNKQLTDALPTYEQFARISSAVNFLRLPVQTQETGYGIEVVNDASGAINISGTYNRTTNAVLGVGTFTLEAGSYTLSGVKDSVGQVLGADLTPSITLQLIGYEDGQYVTEVFYVDQGDGVTFNLTRTTGVMLRIGLRGSTLYNVPITTVIKPMVRPSVITSDSYALYAMTNRQLTEYVASLEARISALEGG